MQLAVTNISNISDNMTSIHCVSQVTRSVRILWILRAAPEITLLQPPSTHAWAAACLAFPLNLIIE